MQIVSILQDNLAGLHTCPQSTPAIPNNEDKVSLYKEAIMLNVTSNWEADKVKNQGKIWQSESEIGYTQLSQAHHKKDKLFKSSAERENMLDTSGEAVLLGQFYKDRLQREKDKYRTSRRMRRSQKIRTYCQS